MKQVYSLLPDKWIVDSWYCRDEAGLYHAFFLEGTGAEFSLEKGVAIGHATSSDLLTWDYKGVVIAPSEDTHHSRRLATGSVIHTMGKWYMMYTGYTMEGNKCGFYLAVSDDLMSWTPVQHEPVIDCSHTHMTADGHEVIPLADPYLYPEMIDGWYYAYTNTQVTANPKNERGAQVLFRSKDLIDWEPYMVSALDHCDRMETSQVWEHGGLYYMYSGNAVVEFGPNGEFLSQELHNYFYRAEKIEGPYTRCEGDVPKYGETPPYIAKMIIAPDGREVIIANTPPVGADGLYNVTYTNEGLIIKE